MITKKKLSFNVKEYSQRTKLILVLIYLGIAILANVLASDYIYDHYKDVPRAPDLFLDKFSNASAWATKAAEIIIMLCFVSFMFIFMQEKTKQLEWIFIFASFQLARGILMPLTVLGPLCYQGFLTNFITFSYGLFPSGHTAIPFMFFLFTYKRFKIWPFYLLATVAVAWLILLGEQHYTIDVLATIFIVYSIYCFSERNIFR